MEIDQGIRDRIIEQLRHDCRIDSSKISVHVKNGMVTLNGTVPNIPAQKAAVSNVWNIPGVITVDSRITVSVPSDKPVEKDSQMRSKIECSVSWDSNLEGSDIRISVNNGSVTIEGSVDNYWKKVHAEDLVSNIRGINKLSNKISVIPTGKTQDEDIAGQIRSALERENLDASGSIGVKVENGLVTLSGTVRNRSTRTAVYYISIFVYGVVYVDNRINVKYPDR